MLTKSRLLWAFLLLAPLTPLSLAAGPSAAPELPTWDQLMTDSVKALRDNRLPQAIALCDQAAQLARGFPTNDTRLSRSQTLRAEIYMWEKNYDLAEKTFREAITSCENAAGPNNPAMVHPLSSLANFYYFVLRQYDPVITLFTRILHIVESSPSRTDRDVILWSRNLASVYQTTGRFELAEPLFQRAVALAETNDPEWLPHELQTAANFYRAWNKCDRAEALAGRALVLREKSLTADRDVDRQLDLAVALDTLGSIDLACAKPGPAEAAYRRSLDLVESFLPPNDSDLAPRLAGLAEALRLQGKYDKAEPLYRRALAIVEINSGTESPEAAALRNLCDSLRKMTNTAAVSPPNPSLPNRDAITNHSVADLK